MSYDHWKTRSDRDDRDRYDPEEPEDMELKPKDGFDWSKVAWGRPDSVPSVLCSYCSASIGEDEVPLILWTKNGHAARFCDACMKRWWGME